MALVDGTYISDESLSLDTTFNFYKNLILDNLRFFTLESDIGIDASRVATFFIPGNGHRLTLYWSSRVLRFSVKRVGSLNDLMTLELLDRRYSGSYKIAGNENSGFISINSSDPWVFTKTEDAISIMSGPYLDLIGLYSDVNVQRVMDFSGGTYINIPMSNGKRMFMPIFLTNDDKASWRLTPAENMYVAGLSGAKFTTFIADGVVYIYLAYGNRNIVMRINP